MELWASRAHLLVEWSIKEVEIERRNLAAQAGFCENLRSKVSHLFVEYYNFEQWNAN
jgi:hypothetical protein